MGAARGIAISVGATAAIIACSVLPLLPGPYDPLAFALGFAAYVFGIVGLVILVPVGVVWWILERRRPGTAFAIAALVATGVVAALVGLATLATSVVAGAVMLVLAAYALSRAARRADRSDGLNRQYAAAMVVVPLTVALVQWVAHGPAVERSRHLAMSNAEGMITAIEEYRQSHGRYPESLIAVWPDYRPALVGVRSYAYEPSGADAFNLSFEQFRFFPVGTREFVVYNPRDEQQMISHASWRMIAPALGGHYSVRDAGRPHWRYFWFD